MIESKEGLLSLWWSNQTKWNNEYTKKKYAGLWEKLSERLRWSATRFYCGSVCEKKPLFSNLKFPWENLVSDGGKFFLGWQRTDSWWMKHVTKISKSSELSPGSQRPHNLTAYLELSLMISPSCRIGRDSQSPGHSKAPSTKLLVETITVMATLIASGR
jgi:hypothetical protein